MGSSAVPTWSLCFVVSERRPLISPLLYNLPPVVPQTNSFKFIAHLFLPQFNWLWSIQNDSKYNGIDCDLLVCHFGYISYLKKFRKLLYILKHEKYKFLTVNYCSRRWDITPQGAVYYNRATHKIIDMLRCVMHFYLSHFILNKTQPLTTEQHFFSPKTCHSSNILSSCRNFPIA